MIKILHIVIVGHVTIDITTFWFWSGRSWSLIIRSGRRDQKFRRGQLDEVEASVGCLSKAEVLKAAAGLGLSKQKAEALFNRLVSLA